MTGALLTKPEDIFQEVQRQYMPALMAEIKERALAGAPDGDLTYQIVFRAFDERLGQAPSGKPLSRGERFFSFMHANLFIIVTLLLTLSFGALGLWSPNAQAAQGYLDISKIFAGAIVGGAASSAISSATSKKRNP